MQKRKIKIEASFHIFYCIYQSNEQFRSLSQYKKKQFQNKYCTKYLFLKNARPNKYYASSENYFSFMFID